MKARNANDMRDARAFEREIGSAAHLGSVARDKGEAEGSVIIGEHAHNRFFNALPEQYRIVSGALQL